LLKHLRISRRLATMRTRILNITPQRGI